MATSVANAIGAGLALLLLGFSVEPLPTSAQSAVLLTLAKGMAISGSKREQSGDFDGALNDYGNVILGAKEALRDLPASDPLAAREAAWLLLASGHIDTARVLLKKAAAAPALETSSNSATIIALLGQLGIARHLNSADEALKTAEALEQQSAVCCSYLDIIYAERAELHLLKGETVQATSYFTAVVSVVQRTGRQKVKAWAVAFLSSKLAKTAGVLLVKELAASWWGPEVGSVTEKLADPLFESLQNLFKANGTTPR